MPGRRIPITVLSVALFVWGSALGNEKASAYSIKSISAQFYHEEEGRLGASHLFGTFTALWDAFIEEGGRGSTNEYNLIHLKGS